MQDIGRKWTLGVTAPIVAGITAVSKAAIDWEDSFAGVRKSVDGTEEQLTQLDKSLRKMTETIPLAHKELANIAESAGQLGIQTDNIAEFVKTMAMPVSYTHLDVYKRQQETIRFFVRPPTVRNMIRISSTKR